MILAGKIDSEELRAGVARLRGPTDRAPDASVIFPVEAQGDMENLIANLIGVTTYQGKHTFELIPVINNYPQDDPPVEIEALKEIGVAVVALPDARVDGEVVGFSARIPGLRVASSDITIHIDSDCRIGNPTKLFDHYVKDLSSGVQLSYTPVLFFDLQKGIGPRLVVWGHVIARWVKRNVLGVPTARGSNYAISKKLLLTMYDTGKLKEDIYIGKNANSLGAKIAYCGDKDLAVYTSARVIESGLCFAFRYLRKRFMFHVGYLGDNTVAKAVRDKS